MVDKLISIVLPVYNGEKYLRKSIDSVLSQTYTNWELLILDDCSSDNTPAISKEYQNKDPRVHYYRNETNLRLPRNLNRGFSLSKGDYLTWTSDDNLYFPTAIEKMVNALENDPTAQFVFASCRIINDSDEEIEYIMVDDHSPTLLVGCNPVGACFLYSRKVYEEIGDYDPDYTLVEDFDYWQRICTRFKALTIPEILYYYRLHSGSLTGSRNNKLFFSNLEKMLLKNRPLFGRLSIEQRYLFYKELNRCRVETNSLENPYKFKYSVSNFFFILIKRLPAKICRTIKKVLS